MNAAFSALFQKSEPSIYSSDLPPIGLCNSETALRRGVIAIYSESIDWEIRHCRTIVRARVGIICIGLRSPS
jgi:hypothetical protein